MFKKILIHVKYPYAVGIALVMWVGTVALYAIDNQLSVITMIVINCVVTIVITKHAMN